MPQPPRVNALADRMIAAYEDAWRRVLAEQQRIVDDPTLFRRRSRLEEMSRSIARMMDKLDADLARWIAEDFPKAYAAGLLDGASAAGSAATWTAIHQRAVEELAYGIYEDLLEATRFVRQSTKDLIRMIARREGLFALIGGDTAQGAGRTMARALAEHGITAVVYRNGARHGLAEYAEMNMRTTTALGYNHGTLNGAQGIQYFEVFDGPGCGWSAHNAGQQALGLIVTREEAYAFPIAHPRCRRAFGPRPDITSPADIADRSRVASTVQEGNVTLAQRQSQINQDRLRTTRQRTARNARARRTRRTARAG